MHVVRSTGEKSGQEAALAAIYDEYYDRIARCVSVKMNDRAEAGDLAVEVLLKELLACPHELHSFLS